MQPNVMVCYCVSVCICLPICRCQFCHLQELEVMVLLPFCFIAPLLVCDDYCTLLRTSGDKPGKQVNWQTSLSLIWRSSIALSKYSVILLMKSSRWQSYFETVLVNPLHCHGKKICLLAFLFSEIYKKRSNVPVKLLILTLLTALFMCKKKYFRSRKKSTL